MKYVQLPPLRFYDTGTQISSKKNMCWAILMHQNMLQKRVVVSVGQVPHIAGFFMTCC